MVGVDFDDLAGVKNVSMSVEIGGSRFNGSSLLNVVYRCINEDHAARLDIG